MSDRPTPCARVGCAEPIGACDAYCDKHCRELHTPPCELCGKPCPQPWQRFCGAACCARYEAGARMGDA